MLKNGFHKLAAQCLRLATGVVIAAALLAATITSAQQSVPDAQNEAAKGPVLEGQTADKQQDKQILSESDASEKATKTKRVSEPVFRPSEEISEDSPVPFPVDI